MLRILILLLFIATPSYAGVLYDDVNDKLSVSGVTIPTIGTMCYNLYPNFAQSDNLNHIFVDVRDYAANGNLFGSAKGDSSAGNAIDARWIQGYTSYGVQTSTYTLTQSAWNVLCFIWDDTANTYKAYLNKSQIGDTGSTMQTWDTSTRTFAIGNCGQECSFNLDGNMAEVAIWNRVLTITELDNRGDGLLASCISTGLIHYWPLNNTSDITDHAGSADLSNNGVTNAGSHPTTQDCPTGRRQPFIGRGFRGIIQ